MKYVCNVCGWVYDEDEQGVKWEDLPEDFACELCGVGKMTSLPRNNRKSAGGLGRVPGRPLFAPQTDRTQS